MRVAPALIWANAVSSGTRTAAPSAKVVTSLTAITRPASNDSR